MRNNSKVTLSSDNLFMTADLHLGHNNILQHCNRPFEDIDDMDAAIIDNWNSVVPAEGNVIVAGDITLTRGNQAARYLKQFNGNIYWVPGNHDRYLHILEDVFAAVSPLMAVTVIDEGVKQLLVVCHYAMRTWDRRHYGAYHAFGHSHGGLLPFGKSCDIGVDCHNYTPLAYQDYKEIMDNRPLWEEWEIKNHAVRQAINERVDINRKNYGTH